MYLFIRNSLSALQTYFPPLVTSSANEFHRVLSTAEVGRLAAHCTKWASGELLCSCGEERDCSSGALIRVTACSGMPQTNKRALVEITWAQKEERFTFFCQSQQNYEKLWEKNQDKASWVTSITQAGVIWCGLYLCCDHVDTAAPPWSNQIKMSAATTASASSRSALICVKVIAAWCSNLGAHHT